MNNIKRILVVIVVFALVAVVANDVCAYLVTKYYSKQTADKVARSFAAEYVKNNSETSANFKAKQTAVIHDSRLKNYQLQPNQVIVLIEVPLKRTIFIGNIGFLKPLSLVKITGNASILEN